MSLVFEHPWMLWGLLAVPLVAWLGLPLRSTMGARRGTVVVALRSLAVTALVLALASPLLSRAGTGVDVAFLVDGSDSARGSQAAAQEWVNAALAVRDDGDRAALARFGRNGQLEFSLRDDPPSARFDTVVVSDGTDIARGLRLAQGVLGTQQRRRVVLLTDGRATVGDAVRTAAELAASGVSVDVVPLGGTDAADLLVESVAAPSRTREGQAYDVTAHLLNTGGDPATVTLSFRQDGEEIERREVVVPPGGSDHVRRVVADTTGAVRHEVRIEGSGDIVPANDVGRAGVLVDGPATVLVVEGRTGEAALLVAALESSNIGVEVVAPGQLPDGDQLLAHESVVLVNVAADQLADRDVVALDSFVRDAGHGLVLIGGDQSFGAGSWEDTPLEELSPVYAQVQDPEMRPSVAEALVVDVSGSMAACHCRPDGFAGGPGMPAEGGINKTDITKVAVTRAIEALEAQDTVGVLAFNDTAEWVLPLQLVPDMSVVEDAVARLHPEGATNVVNALETAIEGLRDVNARLRHIVLFTDGFSEEPAMVDVVRRAREEGITVSVVATGEGTGEVLEEMAEVGGGRFYPGRDLRSIPDILVSEVQLVARPVIQEGEFFPTLAASDPIVDDLDSTPALLGYLATTSKPTAKTMLRVGEEADPLLARWQLGLGTTIAWTSDATSIWAAPWVSWESYATFFTDMVTSTFPTSASSTMGVQATAGSGGVQVTATATSSLPQGVVAEVTVVGPDGDRTTVEMDRSSTTEFTALVPGDSQGVHTVSVRLLRGEELIDNATTTAIRSWSAEYLPTDDDLAQMASIAEAGSGRLDPAPDTAFVSAGLDPGSARRSLVGPLTLLALLTVPIDIGIRRLRLRRSDFRRKPRVAGEQTSARNLADSLRLGDERRHRGVMVGDESSTALPVPPPSAAPLPPVAIRSTAPAPPPPPPATAPPPAPPTSPPPRPAPPAPPTAPPTAPGKPATNVAEPPLPADPGVPAARRLLDARRREHD